jgi:hypothetical protein
MWGRYAAQALIRIGQVMEDAAAIDVVEGREREGRQIEHRMAQPLDVVETANARALLRNRGAGLAQVQVDERCIGVLELLGQVDGGVPGAAAGNQGPEPLSEGLAAAEAVVADHGQVFEPRRDQPLAFVLGIARRIGKRFVLDMMARSSERPGHHV